MKRAEVKHGTWNHPLSGDAEFFKQMCKDIQFGRITIPIGIEYAKAEPIQAAPPPKYEPPG